MQIPSVYAVGGQQKDDAHAKREWHQYAKGIILKIDPGANKVSTMVEYVSPPEACAVGEDPSILFKAGTIKDNKFYVCTQTEIVIYNLPTFEQIGYISLPCFNDVHHVKPRENGNLLVAVTGLDMVVEVTVNGEVVQEWGSLGQNPWERFSREIDYRHVVTTKPHQSHPNYVFEIGEDIWVTRFVQKDAICLTRPNLTIPIGLERVHDGNILGDFVYFTTVDGHVVKASLKDYQVKLTVDLNKVTPDDQALGWCRSLYILDEDLVMVGFSRLRPTKIQENVRWLRARFGIRKDAWTMPAHVDVYDLKREKLVWRQDLENTGLAAVFSLNPVN